MTAPEWEPDDHDDHDCQIEVESAMESYADHLAEIPFHRLSCRRGLHPCTCPTNADYAALRTSASADPGAAS